MGCEHWDRPRDVPADWTVAARTDQGDCPKVDVNYDLNCGWGKGEPPACTNTNNIVCCSGIRTDGMADSQCPEGYVEDRHWHWHTGGYKCKDHKGERSRCLKVYAKTSAEAEQLQVDCCNDLKPDPHKNCPVGWCPSGAQCRAFMKTWCQKHPNDPKCACFGKIPRNISVQGLIGPRQCIDQRCVDPKAYKFTLGTSKPITCNITNCIANVNDIRASGHGDLANNINQQCVSKTDNHNSSGSGSSKSSDDNDDDDSDGNSSKLSKGAIVAIALGAVCVMCVCSAIAAMASGSSEHHPKKHHSE